MIEAPDEVDWPIHKAEPAEQFKDDASSTCVVCHGAIHKVPGGHGPTWVHSDTGTVVGSGSREGN